jgi:carboxyl-terminal processing protease
VKKIRGAKGTTVKLLLQRGDEEPFELTIARDRIHVDSVTSETLNVGDKRVVHVTINQFNNDTYTLFSGIATQISIDRPDGVILDLRNNPGGYLDAAVDVLSEFVDDGSPAVYERKSDGKDIPYTTNGSPALAGMPTVVLMNAGSASASEIVAGALQDYKKATVIGTTSFGKGTVQDVRNYSDGSTLKLTIAQWLTPQKKAIDKTGVIPEFYKENAKDDYSNNRDPQLDAAKLFFSNNTEFLATVQPPTEEQKKPLSQK